jgi:hypothetical protein
LKTSRLIIATGANSKVSLLKDESCVKNYPQINSHLESIKYKNLFYAGVAASLIIGPVAKQIDGARIAAKKILRYILSQERQLNSDQYLQLNSRGTQSMRI